MCVCICMCIYIYIYIYIFFFFFLSDNKAATAEACRTEEDITERAGECIYSEALCQCM